MTLTTTLPLPSQHKPFRACPPPRPPAKVSVFLSARPRAMQPRPFPCPSHVCAVVRRTCNAGSRARNRASQSRDALRAHSGTSCLLRTFTSHGCE